MFVQEPIQASIWHCLNHYAYKDAIFLAERLYAEVETEDSLFLLATAYYRGGQRLQCYDLLKRNPTCNNRCRYLMTLCCTEMDKIQEAEELLSPDTGASSVRSNYGDAAPFANQLLGRICTATDRQELAKEAYLASLKANPFLWESYSKLCSLGENVDPEEVFQVSHLDNFGMCHGTQNIIVASQGGTTTEPHHHHHPHHRHQPLSSTNVTGLDKYKYQSPARNMSPIVKSTPASDELGILHPSNKNRPNKFRSLFTSTPTSLGQNATASTFGFLPLESSPDSIINQPLGNSTAVCHSPFMVISSSIHELSEPRSKKPCLRVPPSWQQQQQQQQQQTVLSPATPAAQSPLNTTNVVRRSSRLFSNSNVSVKENNKTPPAITRLNTSSKSPNRKNRIRAAKTTSQENQKNTTTTTGRSVEELPPPLQTPLIEHDLMEFSQFSGRDFHFMLSHPITDKSIYLSFQGTPKEIQNTKELELRGVQMQKAAAEGLMSLLRQLGKAYLHLTRFECSTAVSILVNLKEHQRETGSVLSLIAKAHFESGQYEEAVHCYSMMREREPFRFEGIEWLSTAYWHLQNETALSALAHDLLLADKAHEATWISAGNCFSLQKEHETAITFFKRAIQVNPRHAYAYTLLGHEYVATEELEKAMMAFRNAARLDPRHYNAWYGMGMIFYKQERYERAEVYYRKALAIHPNNSVLLCHLGVVQHAENRTEKSLATFTKALKLNENNPLCKFHRASVLFAVNRLDEALVDLNDLTGIVPKESLVYFLIAKVYSKKGETHQALIHFSWATDLDPKGANNQIKESIEPIISRSANTSSASSLSRPGGGGGPPPVYPGGQAPGRLGVPQGDEVLEEISASGNQEISL